MHLAEPSSTPQPLSSPASPTPEGDTGAPLSPSIPLDTWLDHLSSLDLCALSLDTTLARPIHLRDPTSVVVRGLFGERLRDLRCQTRASTCEGCTESSTCDYARLIGGGAPRPLRPSKSGQSGLGATDLHPYWLQGIPVERDLDAGASFRARLLIAGGLSGLSPYLDVSLRDALAHLGPGGREGAARHTLSKTHIHAVPWPDRPEPARVWRIEAVSPLLLRGDLDASQALCPNAPWLGLLVRAGLRRLSALRTWFGPATEPALPWAILPSLTKVDVIMGGFREWSGERFSQRQGQTMTLTGIVGEAVVRGEGLTTLGRLLRVLELTSVGKATTMGFGHVKVEPVA